MNDPLVMGIDVGTQGARVAVADARGSLVSQAARAFGAISLPGLPSGHVEQDPEDWWSAVAGCVSTALLQLAGLGRSAGDIAAIAVDSTSGTVVLVDDAGMPLRPAVMYSDRRAQAEADEVNAAAGEFAAKVGYRFNASFALPRLLWLARHEPEVWRRTRRACHAADFVVGRLTGTFGVTDQSNALKTGFDLVDFAWPGFLERDLCLDRGVLPRVVWTGDEIGRVSAACAAATGLAEGARVVAGMTDSCADQVSSGAARVGDWNSVLGTTLVLKGMTSALLRDPLGRVYCHRHPSGHWMPGGASNVGARALDERFPGLDREACARGVLEAGPSRLTVYPLAQTGERFPFVAPRAEGFVDGEPEGDADLCAGCLQGVAFAERLAYDVVAELGADVGERVYSTGGASASPAWTQMRADILGREMARAASAGAAMGSAIVAASRTLFTDLAEAASAMVRIESVVAPRPAAMPAYDDAYGRFLAALRQRGYLPAPANG